MEVGEGSAGGGVGGGDGADWVMGKDHVQRISHSRGLSDQMVPTRLLQAVKSELVGLSHFCYLMDQTMALALAFEDAYRAIGLGTASDR